MLAWLLLAASAVADSAPEQTEFFEKRIRPVLSEQATSATAPLPKSSRAGSCSTAATPCSRAAILAQRSSPENPTRACSSRPFAGTTRTSFRAVWSKSPTPVWVCWRRAWPKEAGATVAAKKVFDLQKRKQEHWCWQPPVDVPPPVVKNADWPRSPIDHFILAKLEKGLRPALSDADRRTLLRRVTFDLTGLPPTPKEVDAFVHDQSTGALAKVVDRLLASPHFGERWARHWLDLVRFAETRGLRALPTISSPRLASTGTTSAPGRRRLQPPAAEHAATSRRA